MSQENLSSQVQLPLTYDGARSFLDTYNALPPKPALASLGAADLASVVECRSFAQHLHILWPLAFGAGAHLPPTAPHRHSRSGLSKRFVEPSL